MTQNPLIAPRSTREWQAADSQHYLHPFTDFKSLAAQGARIITRADGVYLYGSGGFPTNTYLATNYWVDVVFVTP